MRLYNEMQLLDADVRCQIIKEIKGQEEQARRDESFRRYELLKDRSPKYIMRQLKKLYSSQETLDKIQYAIANLSIMKKIIEKLARVYSNGVTRTIGNADSDETKKLQKLETLLDFNNQMKTVNIGLRAQKNFNCYVKPVYELEGQDANGDDIETAYPMLEPCHPHKYSVVEKSGNRQEPLAVVFSTYREQAGSTNYSTHVTPPPASKSKEMRDGQYEIKQKFDSTDQTIADSPQDQNIDDTEYIFWSKNLHFTCNCNGEILDIETGKPFTEEQIAASPELTKNPIEFETNVNFAINQDGSFWATGGEDIPDNSIMIGCLIANLNHIGTIQGYGRFWMSGKNLPSQMASAPDIAIKMEYDKDDPTPQIGYVNSNPSLSELRANIESQLAMTLSTNSLSTSGFSTKLDSNVSLPAGISMIIDKSESTEQVEDQQAIFVKKEKKIWQAINKWMIHMNNEGILREDFKECILNEELLNKEFMVTFAPQKVIQSETESLTNIKTRKELGINTEIELIKKDRPGITDAEAKKVLEQIKKEKSENKENALDSNGKPASDKDDPNANDLLDGKNPKAASGLKDDPKLKEQQNNEEKK